MDRIWIYYYTVLGIVLVAAIAYYIITGAAQSAAIREHHIGVNLTKQNGTCRITWLGGWDFDSFYTNVSVNGVNAGHPEPMTVIYNGTCKNIVVEMYDRAVKSNVTLYKYLEA